jgi:hypothetical protein
MDWKGTKMTGKKPPTRHQQPRMFGAPPVPALPAALARKGLIERRGTGVYVAGPNLKGKL